VCDEQFRSLSESLRVENKIVLSVREMWNICNWVRRTKKISGDIAELGVFNGGSAKLICEVEKQKKVFLFDTFEGLPETTAIDKLKKGDIRGDNIEDVKDYLSAYSNTIFYKGFFPGSAATIDSKQQFSFVHLDADTYQSTLAAIIYFYPRLTKGGALISHDYRCVHTAGVKKAFDEFFKDKPEPLIELWDTQVLIIKQ
jgi:O-methyltransferase